MIKISHRGNTDGPKKELENKPEYIMSAIKKGYDVEIDVWVTDGKIFLGHDKPEVESSLDFILKIKDNTWIHCKNFEALNYFSNFDRLFNFFWHQEDDHTLTSHGYIWTYPNKKIGAKSVIVAIDQLPDESFNHMYGICSDYLDHDTILK